MSLLTLLSGPSSTFATAPVALDFKAGSYEESGTGYALTALPGYAFARSVGKGELDGTGVTTFAANTAAVISGVGFYSEDAATNLILQSQTFNTWTQTRVTITADQLAAPDGTTTADLLTEDATSNFRFIQPPAALTVSASTTYTFSLFAKFGTLPFLQLTDNAGLWVCNFDIQNGLLGTSSGCTGYIVPLANGWYRLVVVRTTASETTTSLFVIPTNSASAGRAPSYLASSRTAYIWQAQAIAGNWPSGGPIIPTTTAAVTVPADTLSLTLANGSYSAVYAFDNGTTQTVSKTVSGGALTLDTYQTTLNRPIVQSVAVTAAASYATAAGTAVGSGAATAAGSSVSTATGSSAGSAASSAAGSATGAGAGATTGAGSAAATGAASGIAVGATSGAGTATGAGAALSAVTATATGSGSTNATGAAKSAGAGSTTGSGLVAGVAAAADASNGSTAGAGSTTAAGSAVASSAGVASGTGSIFAVGVETSAATGTVVGAGSSAAIGSATARASGAASGSGVAQGDTASGTLADAAGTCAGTGSASAVGASTSTATGTVAGSGSSLAAGSTVSAATGAARGQGSVTAAATAVVESAGTMAGGAIVVEASGASLAESSGLSSGTSSAIADTAAYSTGVGLSAGFGIAVGTGQSIARVIGSAQGLSSSNAVGVAGSTTVTSTPPQRWIYGTQGLSRMMVPPVIGSRTLLPNISLRADRGKVS